MYLSSFFKGLVFGVLLIVITNFIWGYMGDCTYTNIKARFFDSDSTNVVMTDSLSDEAINVSIARELQKRYGADSLTITYISAPSNKYEEYICGVRSTKALPNPLDRVKKVTYTKGQNQYRIVATYDMSNGNISSIENDNSPMEQVSPITPIQPQNPTAPTNGNKDEKKDSTNQHNQNIGSQSNIDYDNKTDI